jgi:hypothetical protein
VLFIFDGSGVLLLQQRNKQLLVLVIGVRSWPSNQNAEHLTGVEP